MWTLVSRCPHAGGSWALRHPTLKTPRLTCRKSSSAGPSPTTLYCRCGDHSKPPPLHHSLSHPLTHSRILRVTHLVGTPARAQRCRRFRHGQARRHGCCHAGRTWRVQLLVPSHRRHHLALGPCGARHVEGVAPRSASWVWLHRHGHVRRLQQHDTGNAVGCWLWARLSVLGAVQHGGPRPDHRLAERVVRPGCHRDLRSHPHLPDRVATAAREQHLDSAAAPRRSAGVRAVPCKHRRQHPSLPARAALPPRHALSRGGPAWWGRGSFRAWET